MSKKDAPSRRAKAERTDGSSSTIATRMGAFDIDQSFLRWPCPVELSDGPTPASGLPWVLGFKTDRLRQANKRSNGPHADLLHHAASMNLDCLLDRAEVDGNLLVQPSTNDVSEHLELAGGKHLKP